MYYKKVKGEKLYLSPADIKNEVILMTKWLNEDEDIAYNNYFYHSLLGEDKVYGMLEKWNNGPYFFAMVNYNQEFMGHITLFNVSDTCGTLGIYLGNEYRNKGIGQEAIKLLINYLKQTTALKAIHLEVFSFNEKGYHVYTKCGFKECGRWHNVRLHNGKYHDDILMEYILEE